MTVAGLVGLVVGTVWSLGRELRDVQLDDRTRRAVGLPELTIVSSVVMIGPRLVELLT